MISKRRAKCRPTTRASAKRRGGCARAATIGRRPWWDRVPRGLRGVTAGTGAWLVGCTHPVTTAIQQCMRRGVDEVRAER